MRRVSGYCSSITGGRLLLANGLQRRQQSSGGPDWYTSSLQVRDPEKLRIIENDLGIPSRGSKRTTTTALMDEAEGPDSVPEAARVVVRGTSESEFVVESAQRENPVATFLEQQEALLEAAQIQENANLPMPKRPEELIPEFKRIKNSQKIVFVFNDATPQFAKRDQFPALPPPKDHPWVEAPMGPHIVHGDGELGVVGTGEVGFEDKPVPVEPPRSWRGLQHSSVVGRTLPPKNGTVTTDAVVKHSLTLTGRGVFATKDIKAGEIIMIVNSTACNLGFNDEISRLCAMTTEILLTAYRGGAEERDFLHSWVLTGQTSNLVHHFPRVATERVIADIGGEQVLEALELHPVHIARIASIVDMNSMVVESTFAERRGAAYWPEAALLNHSCAPNATYDIMPEHMFPESDYFRSVASESGGGAEDADGQQDESSQATAASSGVQTAGSTPPSESGAASSSPPEEADAAPGTATAKASAAAQQEPVHDHGECCGCDDPRHNHDTDHQRGEQDAANHSEVRDVALRAAGTGHDEHDTVRAKLVAAPGNYLFCCRATKDIAAGEEILISYVPVEWNFDARQTVLHDRYKFWCKCQRCSPTIDKVQARVPKFSVFILVAFMGMQLLVYRARTRAGEKNDEDIDNVFEDSETRGMVDFEAIERRQRAARGMGSLLATTSK